MKKVILPLLVTIFLVSWPAYSQTITGTTPANTAYARNTAITIGSINISGRTGNYTSNFVDILPMHPTTLALDRTLWESVENPGVFVSIPFVVEKAGTATQILAKGTTDTVASTNVFPHNAKNTNFNADNYEIAITSNTGSFANGSYKKVLRLRLWGNCTISTWASNKPCVTADITITLVVSGNTTTMSLSTGTIDFGEVTTSKTGSFTVTITTSQPYTLSMVSTNGFKLEYWNALTSQYEPIVGENVPYQIVINGKTFSPSANPAPVVNVPTITSNPPIINPYPATITLQTVTASTGGDYKDTLTFTASAP